MVIVATVKAIKYHGGMENIYRHIDNLKNKFGLNVIVALNKYANDSEEDINEIRQNLEDRQVQLSLVEGWAKGGEGAIDIAQKLVELVDKKEEFKYMYEDTDTIKDKIFKVATKVYGAKDVNYSEEAIKEIDRIEKLGYGNLPVCIAKTQYSFSDDAKNLECKEDFNITVRDVVLKSGAGFVVVLAGKIMTMPGLPRIPAAETIDIDKNGEIVGIF